MRLRACGTTVWGSVLGYRGMGLPVCWVMSGTEATDLGYGGMSLRAYYEMSGGQLGFAVIEV
eukprot:3221573-Rhodomonas_salina.4